MNFQFNDGSLDYMEWQFTTDSIKQIPFRKYYQNSRILTLSYSRSSRTDDDVDNRLYLDSLKYIK